MPWILLRGLSGSLLLSLGALLRQRMPSGTWTAWPWVMSLRHTADRPSLAFAAYLLGALLMTWAWWDLRRGARPALLIFAAVCVVPMVLSPPLLSDDAWSYVANGWLTAHGHNPYAAVPAQVPLPLRQGVDPMYLHSASPYGPVVQGWGAVWGLITSQPVVLLSAFRLLAVLALVALAWSVPRLAVRTGQDPQRATWLVVADQPTVLVTCDSIWRTPS